MDYLLLLKHVHVTAVTLSPGLFLAVAWHKQHWPV